MGDGQRWDGWRKEQFEQTVPGVRIENGRRGYMG